MTEQIPLPSAAEQAAANASRFNAFSGVSLRSVRSDLVELLETIRVSGFFYEYTLHDIRHVDAMLSQLDWLIPDETKSVMTAADWLLIVLSAYFHDLGMLITKDEYQDRERSAGYLSFREATLNSPDASGQDFAARIKTLESSELERFLYQEYVRQTHASRIRAWIEGREDQEFGSMGPAASEVRRILSPLEPVFKQDLAIVCESHHLDDLDDVSKYIVDRPYGSSDQEAANVQYSAVLLRTIDLLHITRDRTPSVAFRLINPQDPVSQREWAKQSAVRRIRSKVAENSEGDLDASLPRDTIEVHAMYDNADDYFGITSYLEYAEEQLRLCYDWTVQSNKHLDTKYLFPWRRIDTSRIEAVGFLNRPFEFTLDKERILELLTGHTLYNDSRVVLRELVQNALDAVRLAHGPDIGKNGEIHIRWDSKRRVLEISDNGIGMTQDVIERNFLRVGASYYQEPRFQKEHPDFSPISRFGIGVLSTFMVADQVEVFTCHEEEEKARRLQLRTVHGKYLISLLEKTDPNVENLLPSGTLVRLTFRPTAKISNIVDLAKQWIVIPGCKVEASVDEDAPVAIGYKSVKEALEDALRSAGIEVSSPNEKPAAGSIRVIEGVSGGVSLAFAVRWTKFFKEWQFVRMPQARSRPTVLTACTCAEGIRVQSGAPGYSVNDVSTAYNPDRGAPWAVANIVGKGAPRTNVARSDFEITGEYLKALSSIYTLYCAHIEDEISKIQSERGQSLTWASSEAEFLAGPLMSLETASYVDGLLDSLRAVPLLLLEENGSRIQLSANALAARDSFWTLHGALPEHFEHILREIPFDTSFTGLLKNLSRADLNLPDGPLLCTQLGRTLVDLLVPTQWSIAELRGHEERRRCEARWVKFAGSAVWSQEPDRRLITSWFRTVEQAVGSGSMRPRLDRLGRILIPISGVSAAGFPKQNSAVAIGSRIYMLPGTQWPSVIRSTGSVGLVDLTGLDPNNVVFTGLSFILSLASELRIGAIEKQIIPALDTTELSGIIDLEKFLELLKTDRWSVFDTRQWQRHEGD